MLWPASFQTLFFVCLMGTVGLKVAGGLALGSAGELLDRAWRLGSADATSNGV
jgi:hypothetical protein